MSLSDPQARLLAIVGQRGIADGVYALTLESVMLLPSGGALERYRLVDAPGLLYEEVHPLAGSDEDRRTNPGA